MDVEVKPKATFEDWRIPGSGLSTSLYHKQRKCSLCLE